MILLATSGPAGVLGLPQQTVLWLLLSTVVTYVGDMAFFRSTQYIGVARGLPIANAYPLVSVLLAITLLGEPLGLAAGGWYGADPGGGLSRRPPARGDAEGQPAGRAGGAAPGVGLAAGAAFTWGLGVICDRLALQGQQVDLVGAAFLRLVAGSTFLFLLARRAPSSRPGSAWRPASTWLCCWSPSFAARARRCCGSLP